MCVWAWPKVVMNTTAARQGSRRTARTHLKMDVIVQKCCKKEGRGGGGGGYSRVCWHADVNASKSCVHMWSSEGKGGSAYAVN